MSINSRTSIKVLNSYSEFKMKEKGSTFIGQAFFAETEEAALDILGGLRKKYYDATHNCFAYRIYKDKFKYSDDGEPNGTAGLRIFNAIEHFGIQNIIVVVTRYYGGVKLGVGPLGKAYYNAAYEALKCAETKEKTLYQKIKISYDYNFTKSIHKFLSDYEGIILNSSFDDTPYSECLVYPEIVEKLAENLKNISSGRIKTDPYDHFEFK